MKDTWVRIDLSSEQVKEGVIDRIREECFRWYLAAETPAGAQLYRKKPGPHRPEHVAAELYFTPTMARICRDAISAYHPAGTTDCPADQAILLVGTLEQATAPGSNR